MAARVNPLDGFKSATTTNDFRVPARPRITDFVQQHGLMEGLRRYEQAEEQWSQTLEKSVNERIQPKATPADLGAGGVTAAAPPTKNTSPEVQVISSGVSFPGYSFTLHTWADPQWQNALVDFLASHVIAPGTADPTTQIVQFYCADTTLWHQVRLSGSPSTWDIDEDGSQFPLGTAQHAFVSYQYPCPDTGKWHTVKLVGTPPTWDIDPAGTPLPADNLDVAFAGQALYNSDMKAFVTVGLTGIPPTWGYL